MKIKSFLLVILAVFIGQAAFAALPFTFSQIVTDDALILLLLFLFVSIGAIEAWYLRKLIRLAEDDLTYKQNADRGCIIRINERVRKLERSAKGGKRNDKKSHA